MLAFPKIALGALLPAALLLLVQCGTSSLPEAAQPQTAATPANAPLVPALQTTVSSTVPAPVVFDLDALFGLTIDQLKAKFGRPTRDEQANVDGSQRDILFKRKGFLLDVNYDVVSRQVNLLHFADEAGKISYKKLLLLGHVDTASTRYKAAPYPSPFTENHIGVEVFRAEEEQQ